MELEKILTDYLEEKQVKKTVEKEVIDEKFLSIRDLKEEDYEEDEEDDEEEDYEEDEDDDTDEIDILKITDVEKIRIALDILSNVNDYYDGLEEAIMTLQDIIEDNDYE